MTTEEDIPDIRPHLIEIKLYIASDLSFSSFEEALNTLQSLGDTPKILICSEKTMKALGKKMIAWMWDNHRGVSYWTVPAGILKSTETWCLHGYLYAVISFGA